MLSLAAVRLDTSIWEERPAFGGGGRDLPLIALVLALSTLLFAVALALASYLGPGFVLLFGIGCLLLAFQLARSLAEVWPDHWPFAGPRFRRVRVGAAFLMLLNLAAHTLMVVKWATRPTPRGAARAFFDDVRRGEQMTWTTVAQGLNTRPVLLRTLQQYRYIRSGRASDYPRILKRAGGNATGAQLALEYEIERRDAQGRNRIERWLLLIDQRLGIACSANGCTYVEYYVVEAAFRLGPVPPSSRAPAWWPF